MADEWGVLGLDKLGGDDRGERLKEEYNAITRARLAEYQRQAEALVRANVAPIARLAKASRRGRSLAGDELQQVVREALGGAA